jgi:glutaredoxin
MWLMDVVRKLRGPAPILLYGKETCPYTTRARKEFAERGVAFKYIDVQTNAIALKRMLRLTDGDRRIPVIVTGDEVSVGFGGT